MDKVKKFLAQYNISTHTVAGVVIFLVAAYHNSKPVHDFAWSIWQAIPTGVKEGVSAVASLVMLYWQGRKEWTPDERAKLTNGGNNANTTDSNSPGSAGAAAGSGM